MKLILLYYVHSAMCIYYDIKDISHLERNKILYKIAVKASPNCTSGKSDWPLYETRALIIYMYIYAWAWQRF